MLGRVVSEYAALAAKFLKRDVVVACSFTIIMILQPIFPTPTSLLGIPIGKL